MSLVAFLPSPPPELKNCHGEGYTEHRSAVWCHPVGWGAAWRWPVEILPAFFAGSPPAARSRSRGKQTPCSKKLGGAISKKRWGIKVDAEKKSLS